MAEPTVHTSNRLTLTVSRDNAAVLVSWSGRSTEREPALFVTPILTAALDQASGAPEGLVIDFRQLEFMNSSTITPLSKIIERARETGTRLEVRYRRDLNWQELSFSALRIFETPDGRITITGQ